MLTEIRIFARRCAREEFGDFQELSQGGKTARIVKWVLLFGLGIASLILFYLFAKSMILWVIYLVN